MLDILRPATNLPLASAKSGIRLRAANASDREQVIAVINQVGEERKHLQTDHYQPTPEWESLLRSERGFKTKACLLVAERGSQIIGFARLSPETRPWHIHPAGNIGIALLAPYRHQSIGTNMLYLIVEQAARFQYRCLTADILAYNQASLGLFKKSGFVYHSHRQRNLDFLPGTVQEITLERVIAGENSA